MTIYKKVTFHDQMQSGCYDLTEPEGQNLSPSDYPVFEPELSPKDMLDLGVFGGKYMTDCRDEFPERWFKDAKLSPEFKDIKLNYYQVDASLSLKHWQNKGWIHPADPRGWFQWYCRYYYGRRIPAEDIRQIKRWRAMRRHIGAIRKNCLPMDLECRKKQRQALLHWAYDSRKM